MTLEEKFSLLLWDFQELEIAFEKATGGKWIRKSNTPTRQWVGLTDEEKHQLNDALNLHGRFPIIDAIQAKLKEKNT